MGKGDRKTAKGKRFNSSYGNVRPKTLPKAAVTTSAAVAKRPAVAKSAAGKKVVRKTAA